MQSRPILVLVILLLFIFCGAAVGTVDLLVLTDYGTDYVRRFDGTTGEHLSNILVEGSGSKHPTAMAWGPDNNLYIAIDYGSDYVQCYDGMTWEYLGIFGETHNGQLHDPSAVAWGPDGDLYVVDYRDNQVLRYAGITGEYLGIFGQASDSIIRGDPTAMLFTPEPSTLLFLGLGAVMLRRKR